jgi:outer membrane protein assembly factor BamB
VILDDLVVVGSDRREPGARGHVYAFEKKTGRVRWKLAEPGGVMADIRGDGHRLYAVTLEDRLVCLDSKTGKELWGVASGFVNSEFWFNSAPAVGGGRVYFGGLNGKLQALDAESGRVLWTNDLGARITTSVLRVGADLLVGTSRDRLYRIDSKTGRVSAELALEETPQGRLVAWENEVVVFLGERAIAAVEGTLRRVTWTQKSAVPWSSARPYVWKDTVLAGNDRGELFGFRATDGSAVWSENFEGTIRGIGSDAETLYVGTLKGTLFAWRP